MFHAKKKTPCPQTTLTYFGPSKTALFKNASFSKGCYYLRTWCTMEIGMKKKLLVKS